MFKNGIRNNFFLLFFALIFFSVTLYFHKLAAFPKYNIDKQDSAHSLNRDFLRLASMGNKRLMAVSIWIMTLLESDEVHYSKRDMNNWMYHRFRSIAYLDENFYENYLWGGMYLSIVKDDLEGAADIYELGLKKFPSDYRLRYNAGFNYYFEMGDLEKGHYHFQILKNHPKIPEGMKYVVNKLQFEVTQDYDTAISFIQFNYVNTKDETLKRKLISDLYALSAQRDLDCLNHGKKDCRTKDIEGNAYVIQNGTWQSAREFKPYKLFRRQN